MAVGYVRVWWCAAVLAFLLMAASNAAAVNSDFASGEEAIQVRKIGIQRRRLLGVRLDDYGEPSANKGHDPRGGKGRTPSKKRHI